MTTVYKFKAFFTKSGVGTAPSSAPTCTVVDTDNNLLVNAQAATALSNLTGAYIYEYSGADALDLLGKFATTDETMDAQELGCVAEYTPVDVWSYATRTLSAFGFSVTVATNNDKTGYSLSVTPPTASDVAAAVWSYVTRTITSGTITVSEIWDALLTSITTAGSVGKLIKDYLDAAITSRLASASYTAPDNASITAIKAKTDGLPADPASMTDIANAEVSILSAIPAAPDNAGIAAIKAKTDNLPTDPADQSIILDAIAGVSPSSAVLSLAVSQAEADSASKGEVSLTSYHQLTQSITTTSTEDVGAADKIWFAIKDAVSEADASSLIFVEKTAGLSIVAKANYATTTDGSLVVTGSSGNWAITITIKAAATALLHEYAGSAKKAECKALIGGQPILLWSGSADIYQGVIRVLS